ncbi:MAG: hypothetical protein HUU11_05155 [Anaerolineales bacterium]|nr:hypothetical protein [Anaerolineales bacterium]
MNKRDLELLSSYLDGELKPSDSTKLEARLTSDPELASVLNDLRAARTLLRKLPARKAPRNFTLTRKMVGQNPPLPRAYPIFRFATAAATLLFFFSFAANALAPQFTVTNQFGMGGGGGVEQTEMFAAEAATEESAAQAAPAPQATAAAEEPSVALVPPGTELPPAEDATRVMETPSIKEGGDENAVGEAEQLQVPPEAPPAAMPLVSFVWQIGLLIVAVAGTLLLYLMRQASARRWK